MSARSLGGGPTFFGPEMAKGGNAKFRRETTHLAEVRLVRHAPGGKIQSRRDARFVEVHCAPGSPETLLGRHPTSLRGKEAGPQKTGSAPPPPKNSVLQSLWGSAGRFCGRCHTVKSLLKRSSAEPHSFFRTLGAQPSFSDFANSPPILGSYNSSRS